MIALISADLKEKRGTKNKWAIRADPAQSQIFVPNN
jgi:hypothetical protein